jgi:hypothetical protein
MITTRVPAVTPLNCCLLGCGLLALLALAGCSRDDRPAQMEACVAQVGKDPALGPTPGPGQTAEQHHDEVGSAVASCMQSHGYLHDNRAMVDERCVDDVDFSPYCYRKS